MKILILLVLWSGWLMMVYFVGTSVFLLSQELEPLTEPKTGLRVALVVTSLVAFVFGVGSIHIRKHLFWIRRKIDIEEGSGRAVFLGFSIAALTAAGLSCLTMIAGKFLWGDRIMPMIGVAMGIAFVVLLFPRIPKQN